jgi:hypothetical protein
MAPERSIDDAEIEGAWQEFSAGGLLVSSSLEATSAGKRFRFLVLPDDARLDRIFAQRESLTDEEFGSLWEFQAMWSGFEREGNRVCRLEVQMLAPCKEWIRVLIPVADHRRVLTDVAEGAPLYFIQERTLPNIGSGGRVLGEAIPAFEGVSSALSRMLEQW